mmetsp:Transcript_50405/g.56323  ORF Transcript_50405/g.56323 Transcript_50405/m.56323 type:complete len:146 (-) Transcript_50405:8-445(-)
MIDSIFQFKHQHLTTLAIIGTIFVVHQRYKHSCFGFLTYRGDEENKDNKQVNPKDDDDDDDDDDRKRKFEDDSIRNNTTTAEFDQKIPGPQVVPFPWEPTSSSSSSIKFIKRNCTPKIQNEELNFMATMTFANGGIRAPTCPCCY